MHFPYVQENRSVEEGDVPHILIIEQSFFLTLRSADTVLQVRGKRRQTNKSVWLILVLREHLKNNCNYFYGISNVWALRVVGNVHLVYNYTCGNVKVEPSFLPVLVQTGKK